jgi:hypothetical protein
LAYCEELAFEQYACHCGRMGVFGYRDGNGMKWYCTEHRLGQFYADARRDVTTAAPGEFPPLRDNGLPDLQELIELHGGYDKIPPEAWTEWDRLYAAYRERQRYR